MAWHNQSKAGAELIMDISNVRLHLPEGFSRCSQAAYSPSIIIELAELVYIQPALVDYMQISAVHENSKERARERARRWYPACAREIIYLDEQICTRICITLSLSLYIYTYVYTYAQLHATGACLYRGCACMSATCACMYTADVF